MTHRPRETWSVRPMFAAMTLSTAGVLPVFLVGAESIFERRAFGLSALEISLMVSGFLLAASGSSWLSHRIGFHGRPEPSMRLGGVATCVGCALVLGIQSIPSLVGTLVISGVGYGIAQPAVSAFLTQQVHDSRQGMAFAVRQTAVPVATLISGISVAFLAAVGWQYAYAIPIVLIAATFVSIADTNEPSSDIVRTFANAAAVPLGRGAGALIVGIGLGGATIYVFGSFNVPYSMSKGLSVGAAGALAIVGGGAAMLVRLISGIYSDRRDFANLQVAGVMLLIGALGYGAVALGDRRLLIPAALIAFAAGSGWNGLALHALERASPQRSTHATGKALAFTYLGSALGESVFGALVDHLGYQRAWLCIAVLSVVAGTMMLVSWVKIRTLKRLAD